MANPRCATAVHCGSFLLSICFLSSPILAQGNIPTARPDPLAAAQKRLQAALQKCSALDATRFEVSWSDPLENPKKAPASPSLGGKGTWHGDLLHVSFHGPMEDELLCSGRRMIARQKEHGWRQRHARYADGQMRDFLPDPQRLLETLHQLNLQVQYRETGLLEDRPVEFLVLAPEPAEIAELLWQGLLPSPLLSQTTANMNVMMVLVGQQKGGDRTAAQMPSIPLDIAIAIDPATSIVRQVHFRSYYEGDPQQLAMAAAGFVAMRQAGNDAAAKEPKEPEQAGAPVYERGLRQRSHEKVVVRDYIVKLSEHGQAKPPELDAEAKRLLQRQ
jgi:hypothetical protein